MVLGSVDQVLQTYLNSSQIFIKKQGIPFFECEELIVQDCYLSDQYGLKRNEFSNLEKIIIVIELNIKSWSPWATATVGLWNCSFAGSSAYLAVVTY